MHRHSTVPAHVPRVYLQPRRVEIQKMYTGPIFPGQRSCLWLLLGMLLVGGGCGTGLTDKIKGVWPTELLRPGLRPPKVHSVGVGYIPGLTRRKPPLLPPLYVLILRPLDRRPAPVIHETRQKKIPLPDETSTLIGFSGLNFQEGQVTIAPAGSVPDLGTLRHMDAGMPHLPDIPKTFFTLDRLPETVQYALTLHFREVGIETEMLPFPLPEPLAAENQRVAYALGCTIDEFSLFSLRRYQQVRVGSRRLELPVRGPTRAAVSLTLSLYQLPSGRVVWQEQVWDVVHDPSRGSVQHRYRTADDALTLALSRTVGGILSLPNFQAALRLPRIDGAPTTEPHELRFSRPQSSDLLTDLGDKRRSGV